MCMCICICMYCKHLPKLAPERHQKLMQRDASKQRNKCNCCNHRSTKWQRPALPSSQCPGDKLPESTRYWPCLPVLASNRNSQRGYGTKDYSTREPHSSIGGCHVGSRPFPFPSHGIGLSHSKTCALAGCAPGSATAAIWP